MKRIPAARLEAQIRMHQLANYTMIRNWVGQSTSEDFYDLCDKYGILLWDEFFQPNPSDGPNPDRPGPVPRQRPREDPALPQPPLHRRLVRAQRRLPAAGHRRGHPEADGRTGAAPAVPAQFHRRARRPLRRPVLLARRRATITRVDAPFKTEIGSRLDPHAGSRPGHDAGERLGDDQRRLGRARSAARRAGRRPLPGTIAARYGQLANLADFVRKAQLAELRSLPRHVRGPLRQAVPSRRPASSPG